MLWCLPWDSAYFCVGEVCQKTFPQFTNGLDCIQELKTQNSGLGTSATPVTANRTIHRAILGSLNQHVLLVRICA